MRVRDLIRRKGSSVFIVEPEAPVTTVARLLMRHHIGALPVVARDGRVLGLISERDVVRWVDRKGDGLRQLAASEIMRRPAPTCRKSDRLIDVMARMTRERLRHLVVVDDGKLSGVLSVGDLVKQRLEDLEMEANVLRDYVTAQRAAR